MLLLYLLGTLVAIALCLLAIPCMIRRCSAMRAGQYGFQTVLQHVHDSDDSSSGSSDSTPRMRDRGRRRAADGSAAAAFLDMKLTASAQTDLEAAIAEVEAAEQELELRKLKLRAAQSSAAVLAAPPATPESAGPRTQLDVFVSMLASGTPESQSTPGQRPFKREEAWQAALKAAAKLGPNTRSLHVAEALFTGLHERGRAVYGDAWDEPAAGKPPIKTLFEMSMSDVVDLRNHLRQMLRNEDDCRSAAQPHMPAMPARQGDTEEQAHADGRHLFLDSSGVGSSSDSSNSSCISASSTSASSTAPEKDWPRQLLSSYSAPEASRTPLLGPPRWTGPVPPPPREAPGPGHPAIRSPPPARPAIPRLSLPGRRGSPQILLRRDN